MRVPGLSCPTVMRTHRSAFRVGVLFACAGLFLCVGSGAARASAGVSSGGRLCGTVVDPAGAAVTNAWIVTDTGRLAATDASGAFSVGGLTDGGYAVRVVAPGWAGETVPRIALRGGETRDIRITLTNASPAAALVEGRLLDAATGHPVAAYFEILNGSGPVRWFDADGRPYGGRTEVPKQVWHQANRRFWTLGDFAFSAQPGDLTVRVRAEGYAPLEVRRTLKPGGRERLDLAVKRLFDPAAEGWFKGDFHAHGVHGEKLYTVNIPFVAFVLRAEGYRWFYLSSDYSNDGVAADPLGVAQAESGADLLLALNAEYPKTFGGHVGSVGIGPPQKPLSYPGHSNAEAIRAGIIDSGGAAVPLHPLTGHMKSRELPLVMLGAPELLSGFDFYTGWSERLERMWAQFLNRGYRLCRTATSDAAFDLGRTPGTMGATYIHPEGAKLSREAIVEAFRKGRTAIAWDGALLTLVVDGKACGEVFASDGQPHRAGLTLFGAPGAPFRLSVTRNGESCRQFSGTVPPVGKAEFAFDLSEREKAWYTALCFTEGPTPRMVAATSPFYFGEWPCPDPVLAEVEARVFDADTKRPLDAKLTLTGPDAAGSTVLAPQGTARFRARVFQRVRASAAGYADLESGVLDTPAVNAFVASVSEEDLQAWATYEKARQLLQGLTLDFSLRRK